MKRTRRPSAQTVALVLELQRQPQHWHHGYDLCGRLDLQAGTIYPILIRLADRGFVETAWETDPPRGRPPRHLYRLTSSGAELAAEFHAEQLDAERAATGARSTLGAAKA